MKTLADEIHDLLANLMAEFPLGPTVQVLTERLSASAPDIRRAMERLDGEGRALRYRMGKLHRLVPLGYQPNGQKICANCRALFTLPYRKSKRVTCSGFCHVALSWKNPECRAQRLASIKIERQTPKAQARTAKLNRERWSKQSEREKLSRWNKKRWADPAVRAELSAAIQAAQGAPKMRKHYSDLRRDWWQQPGMREKMLAGMKRVKGTPEARAKFSALLKQRWQDPVW